MTEEVMAVIERARGENRSPRVLVTGWREWSDAEAIRRALAMLPPDTIIIHGMARGADRLAHQIAEELGLDVRPRPAMWELQGKAAGVIRNRQMLDERPDLVLAFHPNLAEARGTKHMVAIASQAGVPVIECKGEGAKA